MAAILPFTASLRDGAHVLVREIGPEDRCLLREGFAELSAESRFQRFLSAHKELSEAELDLFASTNTKDHFAIGALGEGEPVGTARYIRDGDDSAELALTIIDSWQRRGLGSLMLGTLMDFARLQGYRRLNALVHTSNSGMQSLLERYGAIRGDLQSTEVSFALDLAPPDGADAG